MIDVRRTFIQGIQGVLSWHIVIMGVGWLKHADITFPVRPYQSRR